MKNLLLTLLLAFGMHGFSQQVVSVMIVVMDNNGAPIANQIVTGTHQGAIGPVTTTGITDMFGVYIDSLWISSQSTMTYFTSGGGCSDSAVFFTNPSMFFYFDTLKICGSGSANCNYTVSAQTSGSGMVSFSSSFQGTATSNYLWTFGDGSSSTMANPTHTYAQSGVYYYCMQVDSCPPVCDSLLVGSTASCNALWTVDSVNSINFAGNVVLWNLSTGGTAINPLNYIWDWGDGTTSTGQYPMHTYSDTGIYEICLTVFDAITNCTDTHCDSLGFDANGNLVYKGTAFTGFTVNVIDPATIGTKELAIEAQVDIYPNPSSGKLFVASETDLINDVKVFSINGQLIQHLELGQGVAEPVEINIDENGVFLLKITTEAGIVNRKVLVD